MDCLVLLRRINDINFAGLKHASGDQEFAGIFPTESSNILSRIMKYF